jgi:hypothetical protein
VAELRVVLEVALVPLVASAGRASS